MIFSSDKFCTAKSREALFTIISSTIERVPLVKFSYVSQAFTLAEVLLTLVIIGILAAITIPTLIENADRQANVTKFQKTYAEIATAMDKMRQDEGVNSNSDLVINSSNCGCSSGPYAFDLVNNFVNRFNVAKGPYYGACGGFNNNALRKVYLTTLAPHKYLNGNTTTYINGSGYAFSTTSGAIIAYASPWGIKSYIVDVNGMKGPNTYAKDIFLIKILSNKLIPLGADKDAMCISSTDDRYCSKAKSGACCSGKLFLDPKYEIPNT